MYPLRVRAIGGMREVNQLGKRNEYVVMHDHLKAAAVAIGQEELFNKVFDNLLEQNSALLKLLGIKGQDAYEITVISVTKKLTKGWGL